MRVFIQSALVGGVLLLSLQAQALTIYKFVDHNGVINYTDKQVEGAQVFVFRDRMVERLSNLVKMETVKTEAGETIRVRNDLYAPVQIELSVDATQNVLGAPSKPIQWILPPRSNLRIVSLAPKDAKKGMAYKPHLKYALGDPRTAPLPYYYPWPWQSGSFRLTQGANGRYSHYTPKGRYAVDIAMPEGTSVVAARRGIVVKTENNQTGRGDNPSGNYVRILHEDGTMGVYLHLMRGSVDVQEGEWVEAGTPIARSGNTGNSTGPHLHFVIQRNVGMALESIPFEFQQPLEALPNFAMASPSPGSNQ